MKFQPIFVILLSSAFAGIAAAGNLTIPKVFVIGETARASEVNDNFTAIKTEIDDNDARINQNQSAMSFKQERVSGSCPAGESIRVINSDGSVSCEIDNNSDTVYSAGSGLNLNGTEFVTDSAVVQSRVSGTCPAGESIRVINTDGSVTCEVDNDTDTNTTYSAGSGLNLNNTEFSVDATVLQNRVTGNCPSGESISAIDANGDVTCYADANTTYSAGSGLQELTPGEFITDPDVVQNRLSQDCAGGSSIRVINRDGTVECEADTDTNTTYSAGTGMQLKNLTEISPADGWISVPPSAFVADTILGFSANLAWNLCYLSTGSAETHFVANNNIVLPFLAHCDPWAPINLPHGATVTNLKCKVDDTTGRAFENSMVASLMRVPITGPSTVKENIFVTGESDDSGVQIISDADGQAEDGTDVVNNNDYAYQLFVNWSTNIFYHDDIKFWKIYGCSVAYTYP